MAGDIHLPSEVLHSPGDGEEGDETELSTEMLHLAKQIEHTAVVTQALQELSSGNKDTLKVMIEDFSFIYFLIKHLSKVAQFIITIRIDCLRELKKGAINIFKKR